MTIDNALFELADSMAQAHSFAESNFRFGLEEGKTVLASLKNDFDTSFECLLEKLNALTGEILLKCFGDSPNSVEKKKVSGYFMELQVEVSDKVLDLKKFQENLNSRCTKIHKKIGYADLTGPTVSQRNTGSTQ